MRDLDEKNTYSFRKHTPRILFENAKKKRGLHKISRIEKDDIYFHVNDMVSYIRMLVLVY